MFENKSRYPIAIDIGNQNVYAIQLKTSRQGFSVRGLAHVALDGKAEETLEKSQDLVSSLKKAIKTQRFSGRRAIAHIPPQNIFSFPLRFQVRKGETLEAAMLRESEEYLPYPMEAAVIDYPSIVSLSSEGGEQYKATIVAARSDHVKQYRHMLKQIGFTLDAVDLGVSSLIRLHQYLYEMGDHPIILGNIGKTQSLLSVVTKDNILAQRFVPWGIQILHEKMLANLDLSDDEEKAKILLKEHGLIYDARQHPGADRDDFRDTEADHTRRAIYQIITPHIEDLAYEFHKIIGYVRSEDQNPTFEKIYLYGQSDAVNHLDDYLERRLNIATESVNPMTRLSFSDKSMLPDFSGGSAFSLALGLAMRKVSWL